MDKRQKIMAFVLLIGTLIFTTASQEAMTQDIVKPQADEKLNEFIDSLDSLNIKVDKLKKGGYFE